MRLSVGRVQAMQQAGVQDPAKCLFVDDSLKNLKVAKAVGWIRCVYFREHDPTTPQKLGVNHNTPGGQEELITEDGIPVINNLQQLSSVWPEIFVHTGQ
jgi:pyrimidine and pyridine-specific 5'-nucleotidase